MEQQSASSSAAPRTDAGVSVEARREQLQAKLDNLIKQRLEFRVEIAQRPAGDEVSSEMQKYLPVLDEQIKLAEFEVGRVAGQSADAKAPSTSSAPAWPTLPALPDEYVLLGGLFLVVAILPLSIALARRIWRRTEPERVAPAPELEQRLVAMQTSIDSVAMEVERIGEGQRYVTGLLNAQLGGAPQEARQQMPEAVSRRELSRAVTPH